jgi:formylglycine-generating enzyme required for sulfatase activity
MVGISEPFAVGRFAVTRAEFAAFVTDTDHKAHGGCHASTASGWKRQSGRSWRSPGLTQDDGHPVVCVNWEDAKAYVAWLAKKTGKPYRLLSEAEREYIARAGTTTPFWWGSRISTSEANYDGTRTYGGASGGGWRKSTVPVHSFRANPWGVYNVHGNVWEWVEDCWHDNYQGAPTDGSAWTTGDCNRRVLRGGSWVDGPGLLRAASRFRYRPDYRDFDAGFRLARTLTLALASLPSGVKGVGLWRAQLVDRVWPTATEQFSACLASRGAVAAAGELIHAQDGIDLCGLHRAHCVDRCLSLFAAIAH